MAAGEIRWCGVTLPTAAFAQDAGMSFGRRSRSSCSAPATSTTPTRSRSGATQSARQAGVIERLARVAELRIVAEDTDLTVRRRRPHVDRTPTAARTSPTARCSPAPARADTQGHISFSFDATYDGPRVRRRAAVVRGRRGRPPRGQPRRASSWREMLDMDEGSRLPGRGRLRHERRDPAGHRATSRSTRRSAARATSRWAPPSRRPAAPTGRRCTGTSSATCATAARSTATAS